MLFAAEIRQRIGHHKGLDIAHKGISGSRHTTDMGVYARYDELITPGLFQHLLQRRTVKGAVTPLHQHRIGFVRGKRRHNPLLLWRAGQPRPPHIVEQRAIVITLLFWLSGVINRDIVLLTELAQRGDISNHLFHHRAIIAPEIEEILLHIMNQQGGAVRFKGPLHFVIRDIIRGWQCVAGQFGNSHLFSSLRLGAFCQRLS